MDLLALILAVLAGDQSEQAISSAVSAWITAHPEAVTTVQDGAISRAKLDADLQATVDDVGELKRSTNMNDEFQMEGWEQGAVYASSQNTVVVNNSNIRCRLMPMYFLHGLGKVTAMAGYEVACTVAAQDGTQYGSVVASITFRKEIDLKEYSDSYFVYFSAHKTDNSEILPSEAQANIVFTNAVSSLKKIPEIERDINLGLKMAKVNATVQNGKMYWYGANEIRNVTDGNVLTVQVEAGKAYFFTSSGVVSGLPWWYINYIDGDGNFISGEYSLDSSETGFELAPLDVPDNASLIYVNGRNTEPSIYISVGLPSKSLNEIDGIVDDLQENVDDLQENVDSVKKYVLLSHAVYDSKQENKLFYSSSPTRVVNSTGGYLYKVTIDHTKDYYFTASAYMGGGGFAFINYFDSEDAYLSNEFVIPVNVQTDMKMQKITPPTNAAWFYVNSRYSVPTVYIMGEPDETLSDVIEDVTEIKNKKPEKEISILFVGNSLTQDGIAYLPYLLVNYYPEVQFKIYMWYNGGYTLSQQYQKFVNDEACEQFSVAENVSRWTTSSKKMSAILETYTFDIVCMQEYFNYKESYVDADLQDWNNCRDYIQSHYTGGNALKFVSLFHAPLRASADAVFNRTKAGNALILQKTISEDMIPVGIAVYRALSTDLDSLGDSGHLSPDGTHTQEGLPCLLQTYVALQWVLDKLSIPKSVYGFPFKMTAAIQASINVPGANMGTGVIEGTDAENLLAQEVAIKAYKEGKQFVVYNEYSAS